MKRKSTLTVEGVGEDAQSGFVTLADVAAGVKGRAAEAFESANEALDVPAPPVAAGFEHALGHLRAIASAQGAVGPMHGDQPNPNAAPATGGIATP